MGMGSRFRAMFGLPRSAQFSESAPRPIAQVISEMMHQIGHVDRKMALSVPAVKRGRDIICAISTLPLETINGQRKVIRTALLDQIDPRVPDVVTISQTIEDLLFDGVAWWEITDFASDGYPSQARHLDVSQVSVNSPSNGETPAPLPSGLDPRGVVYVDGYPVSIEKIIKFDSPNPPLLHVAGRTIRRAVALDKAAEAYADDPRPQAYFTPTDPTADPAADEEIGDALSAWASFRRKRTTGYVPASLKYNEVQQPTPADLQLVSLQQRAALDIANHIGLDPEDLGVSTTSRTYQNATDRRQDRINDVLSSYMSAITSRLSMGDVTKRGEKVRFNLDEYLRADPLTRSQVQLAYLAAGVVTIDEIRTEEGSPSLAGPARPAVPIPATVDRPVRAIAASTTAPFTFARETGLTFDDAHVDATFSVDEGARTITGLAVPYGQVAQSGGRRFRFAPGSVKWHSLKRVKLLRDHDNSQAVGFALSLIETADGLMATFKVARGSAGDTVLALAADGVLDGLSIGVDFQAGDFGPDPLNPGALLVQRAALREVSLTAMPAFDDSRLTSVRASDDGGQMPCNTCGTIHADGVVQCPTPAETPVAPVTFSADQFAALLAAGYNPQQAEPVEPRQVVVPSGITPVVTEPLPYRFSKETGMHPGPNGYDFSSDLFAGVKGDYEAKQRAEAFVTAAFAIAQTNVAGLNPSIQRPDMYVDQMDYATPLWDMVNRGSISDNTPFIVPKFSSSSGLVGPHTEGTEPTPGAFAATTQTITPTAVSGKVEVNREVIDAGGNPQVSTLLWQQMLREYYEDRESAVATFLNTLTAATDIAITAGAGTNASDLISAGDLEAAIAALQFVRGGNRFSAFAVHVDLYKTLARVKDADSRPLYPQLNPVNANGTTNTLFRTMNIAGTTAVPSWALGATGTAVANSWLFDPMKVHGWASAPRKLNFESLVKQVEIGIWGYTAFANTDIAGVRQVTYDPVA